MSTKTTIRCKTCDTGAGYHFYEDWVDLGEDGAGPVHLAFHGVRFEVGGGGAIDVTLPREWAVELGLLPRGEPK